MEVDRIPRRPARAETVGSLLRPPGLKAAMEAFYAPGHSAALEEERATLMDERRALARRVEEMLAKLAILEKAVHA